MAPMKTWKVTPFEIGDLPSLGMYFKRHLSAASQYGSMAIFHWRAVANYLMPGIINLIKDGDKIVATLSNTPKRLLVKGQECLVAEIGDAYTDPEYQRQGMLTLLIKQSTQDALAGGIRGVYSTPSTLTPSLPAFIHKAGFLPQEDVRLRNLVFPLDIGPSVERRTHWLVGRYASSFFLTFVQVYYLARKWMNRERSSVTIEELRELPVDWDSFWDRSRQAYDVIFERTRQALTWRFFQNPNKYKFYVAKKDGAITGYMVCRVVADEDLKRFVIADFLFLPGCEVYFDVLLLRAFEDALRLGANSISSWCIEGSEFDGFLKRLGFIPRSEIVLVWFQNELATLLKTAGKWHLTISDSDNI